MWGQWSNKKLYGHDNLKYCGVPLHKNSGLSAELNIRDPHAEQIDCAEP